MTRILRVVESVKSTLGRKPPKAAHPNRTSWSVLPSASARHRHPPPPRRHSSRYIGPHYTTIPTKESQAFSNASEVSTALGVKIFGEKRELVRDNKLLGKSNFGAIPLLPKGISQIETTFDIDPNRIIAATTLERRMPNPSARPRP